LWYLKLDLSIDITQYSHKQPFYTDLRAANSQVCLGILLALVGTPSRSLPTMTSVAVLLMRTADRMVLKVKALVEAEVEASAAIATIAEKLGNVLHSWFLNIC
jgi:hypothetical protein